MDIVKFWESVLKQNREEIRKFFHNDAYVNWHCTNEHFTVEEFIKANCEYPGNWSGEIERIEEIGDLIITVTRVYPIKSTTSFHAVSFIKLKDDKILSVDEYWADDGNAPQWRQELHIGKPIV